MLKIKKISDVVGKKVYTDEGDFFGDIEEANLVNNKVDSWRIRVSGGISNLFNGARGVIIPHSYVKSVGDVFIINRVAMPSQQDLPEIAGGLEVD
ncbi:photosystem reaction center subunit H [Candidatus Pacearchaeota archaeon CG10_big_fil_rev_8_21_14_0_10_30_48]|nr:MAG: photosystem reaction center subunit H [Candidatus Pacearchaeota archaeon CG10_big_fil_rev_8_21_14_0_10_30_48]